MKPLSINIIPTQPGFFLVYDINKKLEVYDQIIAWRIETYQTYTREEIFSTCTAITVDGDEVSNSIGVQNPDMTVTIYEDANYGSLAEAEKEFYPENKA